VVARLHHTDTTLNFGECALHRRARQMKVSGKLGEGCIRGSRSRAGDPRMQSVQLQEILL
jgi:hypothetical protein